MVDDLLDFSERCRLCIEPKRLSIDIFSEEGRRMKLKSKINKNLFLQISRGDGLPNQICYQCLFRLETWVSFKQLCTERDKVLKTWSQAYMDETSCEVDEAFSAEQDSCKLDRARDLANSQPGTAATSPSTVGFSGPCLGGLEPSMESFNVGSQMDDVVSEQEDPSLWETEDEKATDIDMISLDCDGDKNSGQNSSKTIRHEDRSSLNQPLAQGYSDLKSERNKRKSMKPSKMPSSGSDTSTSLDTEYSPALLKRKSLSKPTPATTALGMRQQKTPSPERNPVTPTNSSPLPLKRKRGRPSKAFLQRERELKKLREKEKKSQTVTDAFAQNVQQEVIKEVKQETKLAGPAEKFYEVKDTKLHLNPYLEFNQVSKGDSGVTEVVLEDPDFGSMKFTLSVVEIDSPVSSPEPLDDYQHYPESCTSSCGNISLDSQVREDFEGFECPKELIPVKMCDASDLRIQPDTMPRSRSLADVSTTHADEPAPKKERKRSCSVSATFSGELEANIEISVPSTKWKPSHSKSLDDVCTVKYSDSIEWLPISGPEALSDGESIESVKRHRKRKFLLCR